MIIDFLSLPFEDLPNFKGGDGCLHVQMYFDGTVRIMHATLAPGASIGLHRHEGNCEVLFLLRGEATLIDDGVSRPLCAGQCAYCPDGHEHSLLNTGDTDAEFYATVV